MTDEAILRRQYDELAADNGRLLNRLAVAEAQTAEVDRALIACQERCNRLAEGLAWYADPANYAVTSYVGSHVDNDDGERARALLAEHDAARGEG